MITKKAFDAKLRSIMVFKSDHKLNFFLFNLVLKGIVDFEVLSLNEKKALIRILENKHSNFFYDEKLKKITTRRRLKN